MTMLPAISPLAAAGFLALGLAAGGLFFALLRWNAALYAQAGQGGGPLWRPLVLSLSRLLVLGAILTAVAHYGALPLLAAALGVMIARPVVTRMMTP